ncbi:hypothetical protein SYJ56_24095 [Algoriphagus sp. D3-2-R+10]|uniref:hypothetical protein n=1 Tax=Algoriphagus aurantiacus TaxID=3103948 RepID=UPI002B3C4683|nr:hypothetical protein [Algoriphagus sp. D3-2-R+10]MEB2778413.1 hypothetical protein [Algoriphagus sp. D3-2-R+10]
MKLLKSFVKVHVDTLYIGDLREDTMKLFVSNLNFSRLFHLDDGASTLNIRDLLKENPLNLVVSTNIIKRALFTIFNFSLYKRIQLNWFTIFDFFPVGSEKIINHNFLFLKSTVILDNKSKVNSQSLYFIGSNLINAGVVLSPNDYLQLLAKAFTKISSSKITYLLHRHEDVSLLEVLKNHFDIEFVSSNEPIEITFSKKDLNGCVLASFYSTALFTLNKLVNCEMLMINIPEFYLSKEHSENTLNVQKYYSSIFKSIII